MTERPHPMQQLIDARTAAHQLFGDRYDERVEPFRAFIREIAAKLEVPPRQIVTSVARECAANGTEGDVLCCCAAIADVLEAK